MTSISSNINQNPVGYNVDWIVLQGYHKKLKTMKKKYFVLCGENGNNSARLEYYDSEKKFKSRSNPKRTIILKNCFNINRRMDTKHKFVIALSTKEEGFCIVLDSEQELNTWLKALLALQRGEDTESDPPKPNFEHVWQVQVQRKGLAEERGIIGSYHVCLTTKSLTLFRIGPPTTTMGENRLPTVEFYLTTIRRCGDSQCFFYMEVGRHSAIGAGELWMETEDHLIAQNMHTIILNAMSSCVRNRDDGGFGPMRKRSSSANEASKPISVMQRRQTHSSNRPMNSSPLSGTTIGRERCDSLPSRNRTASECSSHSVYSNSTMPPPRSILSLSNRPHSMYNNRHSHSPPTNTLSPSTGCSESDGSSLSIDETDSFGNTPDESGNFGPRYFQRTSKAPIPEENSDDFWYSDNKIGNDCNIVLDKLNNRNGVLSLPLSSSLTAGVSSGGALNLSVGTTTPSNVIGKGSAALHIVPMETSSQYMDMHSPYSPCSSSPGEQTGSGCIPISPGVEFPKSIYTGSSDGHSRASSLAEETVDGYVPMGPPQPTDYVDMEQTSKQQQISGLSSAASSSSITSGTPSTDLRFAEYSLDKVKSRFTPDDEDISAPNERPIRAYSFGSRIEHNKRKLRVDVLTTEQSNSRVRAFSVGSRAKVPRSELFRGVFAPSLTSCNITNNNNITNTSELLSSVPPGKGKKSSSAPILVHKSHSSVDRMSDLMEIDFSKNSDQSETNLTSSPSRISSTPLTVPLASNHQKFNNTTGNNFSGSPQTSNFSSGYVDMRPGHNADKDRHSFSGMSTQHNSIDSGYLEMRPIGLSKSPSLSSSPIKVITSPKSTYLLSNKKKNDYLNMSPNSRVRNNSDNYVNVINNEKIIENKKILDDSRSLDTDYPDVYMEMSWNCKSCSNENVDMILEEQQNYDIILEEQNTNDNSNSSANENRCSSSPIDIKLKNKNTSGLTLSEVFSKNRCRNDSHDDLTTPTTATARHASTIFPFSPGSPLKSFVSANDFAQRKCLVDATNGKIILADQNIDLSENLNELSMYSDSSQSGKSPLNATKVKILNTDTQKIPIKTLEKVESLSSDYADMTLNSMKNIIPDQNLGENLISDYANLQPVANSKLGEVVAILPEHQMKLCKEKNPAKCDEHDYEFMASQSGNKMTNTCNIPTKKKTLTVMHGSNTIYDKPTATFEGFKPIASNTDKIFLRTQNNNCNNNSNLKTCLTKPLASSSSIGFLNKQLSERNKNIDNDSSAGYEVLQMRSDSSIQTKKLLTRPNSVNSEKISSSKTDTGRPNSVNSDCLPSISSSSSTSTLCGEASSSSLTLCGSKSQSPLVLSNPVSFSDGIISTTSLSSSSSSTISPSVSVVSQTEFGGNIPGSGSAQLSTPTKSDQLPVLLSSRPPSVSSERELHYASLDLPTTTTSSTTASNPELLCLQSSASTGSGNSINSSGNSISPNCRASASGESSTSPSPNANGAQQQQTFTYAQIDFNKSENLKWSLLGNFNQKK